MSHRTGRAGRRVLLGLAALLLGVLLLGLAVSRSDDRRGPIAPNTVVSPIEPPETRAATPTPKRRRVARRFARPVRIEIPAIGVRAPVIRLGLNPDRSLEVPKDFGDTGWWSGGPRPGDPGPAVIVGHVDSYTGPAVFYRVGDLGAGDPITVVGADGRRARFTVTGKQEFPKDHFPTERVYGRTTGPALRLITCSGTFDHSSGHYLDNTVVFARGR